MFLLVVHVLGCYKDPKAIIFSLYSYVDFNRFGLSNDDICDVQSLQGESQKHQPTSLSYITEPATCGPSLNADTVTASGGKVFFFKSGCFWWKLPKLSSHL